MKKLLILLLILASLQGCFYSHVKLPFDTDVAATTLGDKVGRSSTQSVLWLFGWGDGGTEAAAKDGGITTIRHLDMEQTIIFFGAYIKVTTIAYGD